jgi:protein-arginine kinase activator protein McsA
VLEYKRLEDELKKAIASEDFEKAARLRDRLKNLMRQHT